MKSNKSQTMTVALLLGAVVLWPQAVKADQVIPDDLIVQGSGCFGFDCVVDESFGFSTILLKENNLRIFFDDTSVGAFPANKWQITANDAASGGANYFAVDDITSGRQIFRLSAGAPANSLFMSSTGNIGLGTATPVLDLHMSRGNTPGMRFEQTTASGFPAQTWDVASNEANFFVRDLTGGSRLPFRIRPGAPTSSIDIAATGFVGIGISSPTANMHVSSSTTPVLVLGSTAAAHPSKWAFSTLAAHGVFSIGDVTNSTKPIRIVQGAPDDSIKIGATGQIVFSQLKNCGNGIKSNASGALSCVAGPRPPGFIASARDDDLAFPTLMSAAGAGGVLASRSSAAAGAPGTKSSVAGTAGCNDSDLTGSWGMSGNTVEANGPNSVLWCDVQLTKAGSNYSAAGKCRSHSAAEATPKFFDLSGIRSIAVTSSCKLSGSFKITNGEGTTTATIVEGRIQGADGNNMRAVGVSRLQRGKTAALNTFVMQR